MGNSATAPSRNDYTWADFAALDDEDKRELIDGELVDVEMPGAGHEAVVVKIIVRIEIWAQAHGGGRVLASSYKVRINDRRGVMPDVQYYAPANAVRLPRPGLVDGRPDMVVEVISPSGRRIDRVRKLQWYADRAVPEYWLIDPEHRTFEQLVFADGRYSIAQALADDDVFRPASWPGLEIRLADLWAAAAATGE